MFDNTIISSPQSHSHINVMHKAIYDILNLDIQYNIIFTFSLLNILFRRYKNEGEFFVIDHKAG